MRRSFLLNLSLLLVAVAATCATADLIPEQITYQPNNCAAPALASSPNGVTLLAFEVGGGALLMDFVHVQVLDTQWTGCGTNPSAVVINEGHSPVICYSRTGFHLAFIKGNSVLVYHADTMGNWDFTNFTEIIPGGLIVEIDLWGSTTDGVGADVFMVMKTFAGNGTLGFQTLFASCSNFNWSELEPLGQDDPIASARITGWDDSSPIVFYNIEESGSLLLKSITYMGVNGWSDPVIIPGSPVQMEFDVVAHGLGDINILGLGAQPTCPCGSIHHQAYTSGGGWMESEDLTVHYAAYDWPRSPCVAVDSEVLGSEKVHAFWYQLASAPDMMPWQKSLEYKVLENGVWTDEGSFLNAPGHGSSFGPDVAMAVDPSPYPVLAWTRTDTLDGQPQPSQVWIARQEDSSSALQDVPQKSETSLTAFPNPFNPVVKISFNLDQPQQASIDIFDARGRCVNNLVATDFSAGWNEVSFYGKDNAGRTLASGIYFARLVTESSEAVVKLVLTE